jgi:DNA-binding NarL/FixJ family response regulator
MSLYSALDNPAPRPTRLLLVDDHQLVREGLRLTLGREPDLAIAGEAGDGQAALERTALLDPDVILMDISLPDADGVDLSREILQRWPRIRIVVLSAVADSEHLDRAIEAGVAGYVLKVNATDDLVRAIRAVQRGDTFLSPEVSAVLVNGYRRLRESRQTEDAPALTEREAQVLTRIADGRNTKEIAAEIDLSVKTVETHRTRIMNKLGRHSIAELTKYAIRHGYSSV